jgi:hypothetical protein
MLRALAGGLLAASALLVGASLALVHRVHDRTLGLIMAFGAGVLISAVAFDLVVEAIGPAGADEISIGMLAGAVVFFLGDLALASCGASRRKSPRGLDARVSAKGAILTMLADTMMPETFEQVGPVTGLVSTIGFILAFVIATLEHAA